MKQYNLAGSADELHAVPLPLNDDASALWVMAPRSTALVMGSSQKPELFDTSRLATDDVELASRRSGGGAVFIEPIETVWIDVLASRSSRFWSHDLSETFVLVAKPWQHALAELGVDSQMCTESSARSPVSSLACWAGLGWGELTVNGSKAVGLSQRRTRWGARIQAMAVLGTSSARVADYMPTEQAQAVRGAIPTAHATTLATAGVTRAALLTAVLDAFSR